MFFFLGFAQIYKNPSQLDGTMRLPNRLGGLSRSSSKNTSTEQRDIFEWCLSRVWCPNRGGGFVRGPGPGRLGWAVGWLIFSKKMVVLRGLDMLEIWWSWYGVFAKTLLHQFWRSCFVEKIRWISISWKLHFGTNDLDGKTAQVDLNMYSFSSHDKKCEKKPMVYIPKV